MGIFSSKKKVLVSSSVWNMAGDVADRPNLLKTVVAEHMLAPQNAKRSISDALFEAQIKGPGIQQRNFFRWCQTHFPIGVPSGNLTGAVDLGDVDLTPYLTSQTQTGNTALVGSYSAGAADFFYWAEKVILDDYPELVATDWTADLLSTGTIRIQFEDLSTVEFSPIGYDTAKTYLYVYWSEDTGAEVIPHLWIYELGSGVHPKLDAPREHGGDGFIAGRSFFGKGVPCLRRQTV